MTTDASARRASIWRPRVTVACVVARDDRYLLVEERIRGRLVVNQPAGHLDPGETLLQAAVRETLEETAWTVRPTGLVTVYQWRKPGGGEQFLRFTFAAEALSHDPDRALDTGIERALWLDERELDSDRYVMRSPMVRRSIADYRRRAPMPLDVLSALGFEHEA